MMVGYADVGGKDSFKRICYEIKLQDYDSYYSGVLSHVENYFFIEDDSRRGHPGHGVPYMNKVFYGMYKKTGHIPSWTPFIEEYKRQFVVPNTHKGSQDPMWVGEYTFKHKDPKFHYAFEILPLEKKLVRTYMSFLKEQHVMHWLFDKGLTSAYWSFDTDMGLGFDIMVCNPKGKWYGIKVYADTNSAKMYAKIKSDSYKAAMKGISSIAIPVPMNGERLGDTCIASENTLLCMYNLIMNGIETETITVINGQVSTEPGIILGGKYGR